MIKFLKQRNKACPAKLQRSGGFTLIETLVAVVIFTTSIVALMTVLGGSISNTDYAKKKMTATFLAQEGIEYVRNIRDGYVLFSSNTGLDWGQFVNNLISSGCVGGCYFDDSMLGDIFMPDMLPSYFHECSGNFCHLYYWPSDGRYTYNQNSNDSGFERIITIETINSEEIKVNSVVSWKQGTIIRNISFSENLFNWTQPTP